MQNPVAERLSGVADNALAECMIKVISQQLDHEYIDWVWLSFADNAQLSRNGEILERTEYPPGFAEYIPVIVSGDRSYAIATLPGKTDSSKDAVKICLGSVWDSRIAADIEERALTGDNQEVSDGRDTVSRIVGWNLTNVRVVSESENRRIAFLQFQEQGGRDEVVASWGWSGW